MAFRGSPLIIGACLLSCTFSEPREIYVQGRDDETAITESLSSGSGAAGSESEGSEATAMGGAGNAGAGTAGADATREPEAQTEPEFVPTGGSASMNETAAGGEDSMMDPEGMPSESFDTTAIDAALAAGTAAATARFRALAESRSPGDPEPFFCYTGVDGVWENAALRSWCSGFLPGAFWFLYALTGDEDWAGRAQSWTGAVATAADPREANGYQQDGDQDTGFQIYGSHGLGLLLAPELTDTAAYQDVMLQGAASLRADRYNEVIGAFRAWPQDTIDPYLIDNAVGQDNDLRFEVNIDMLMNVELVLAAADVLEASGDDELALDYRQAARRHFETSYASLVRDDGSSFQVVQYSDAGEVINQRTHQGAANETTWSRGQAWGIYGHAMMYRRLGEPAWRNRADELLNYFLDGTREHAVPHTDFARTEADDTRDSSAASIACSALMDLHVQSGESFETGDYVSAARRILLALGSDDYLSGGPDNQESLLWSCTERYGPADVDPEVGCIFGDYYFLECMHRYQQAASLRTP